MTEYWVSKTQYFCKYCNIYIRDDKPSRQQHENGLRHKGNLERYIRSVYKNKAQKSRDAAEEAHEIARINAAAAAAHALDDPSGSTAQTEPTGKGKGKEKALPSQWKGSSSIANYSDARSLGLVDDAMEKEILEQESRTGDHEARVGEWQAVRRVAARRPASSEDEPAGEDDGDEDEERRPPHRVFKERVARTFDEDGSDLPAIKLKRPRFNNGASQSGEDGMKAEEDRAAAPQPTFALGAFRAFRFDGTKVEGDDEVKEEKPTPFQAPLEPSQVGQPVPSGSVKEEYSASSTSAIAAATEEGKPPLSTETSSTDMAPPSLFKKRKTGGTRTGASRSTALM